MYDRPLTLKRLICESGQQATMLKLYSESSQNFEHDRNRCAHCANLFALWWPEDLIDRWALYAGHGIKSPKGLL